MSYKEQKTAERLFFFLEAITIVNSDPVVSEVLAGYGFDALRMETARDIYDRTYASFTARQDRFSDQVQATDRMYVAQATFKTLFRNDRNLVKSVLLQKRSEWEAFGLNTKVSPKREILVSQADYFYNAVKENAFVVSELESRYKILPEFIESRQADLQLLIEAIQDQQHKRAEAQVATQRKRAALKEMDDWMTTFLGIARQAFKGDRKQLEKLGLAAKVSGNRLI